MGIYDRDYVRRDPAPGRPGAGRGVPRGPFKTFNSWLIVINIGIFLLGMGMANLSGPVLISEEIHPDAQGRLVQQDPPPRLAPGRIVQVPVAEEATGRVVGRLVYVGMDPLREHGHFSTQVGFFQMQVWRLITFQFLHADFVHLFFNMFGLFIFGGLVEQYLGAKRYAAFYLTCGICGGILYLILNFLGAVANLQIVGALPNDPRVPLIGASAGVFGVIVACAFIAPNAIVQLIFPPIPLRMKWLAYGYVGLAFVSLIAGTRNAGGEAAHLGGAIAGFFFIRNAHLLVDFFDVFKDSRKPGQSKRPPRGRSPDPAEVDRILQKHRAQGLDSLTESEKKTLRRATEWEQNRRV
jgi:membrane associated rhomboid family serine protease